MLREISAFRVAVLRTSVMLPFAVLSSVVPTQMTQAQAPAPAAAAHQLGVVTAVSGSTLTLKTDAGQQVTVSVADGARILQLAPGSTDLKSAQAITLTAIAAGDRVLVNGKAGDDA